VFTRNSQISVNVEEPLENVEAGLSTWQVSFSYTSTRMVQ